MLNGARSQERSKWKACLVINPQEQKNQQIAQRMSAAQRAAGWSWPGIAKAMGCGVGTCFRAYRSLSKIPVGATLSTNPASEQAAAD